MVIFYPSKNYRYASLIHKSFDKFFDPVFLWFFRERAQQVYIPLVELTVSPVVGLPTIPCPRFIDSISYLKADNSGTRFFNEIP
jgi:hypothetical protein